MHDAEHHHGPAYKTYWAVFVWLMLLTCLTVSVSWIKAMPVPVAVALAFMIAISKASIVAAFFMHLKYDSKILRIICTVPAMLTLLIIIALMPDVGMHAPGVAGPPESARAMSEHGPEVDDEFGFDDDVETHESVH
jgi:cytochrome c oxidase subunit 4